MNLNKSICQKCYAKERYYWTPKADESWNKGCCLCPLYVRIFDIRSLITTPIPIKIKETSHSHCPYLLEHLVSDPDDMK